ncbi:MAG: hypothetical protein RMK20_08600, partial [Verrucomicrobiales bacterium]|nr:hypothetical protein [Verrucomicrobiales bacterium]
QFPARLVGCLERGLAILVMGFNGDRLSGDWLNRDSSNRFTGMVMRQRVAGVRVNRTGPGASAAAFLPPRFEKTIQPFHPLTAQLPGALTLHCDHAPVRVVRG